MVTAPMSLPRRNRDQDQKKYQAVLTPRSFASLVEEPIAQVMEADTTKDCPRTYGIAEDGHSERHPQRTESREVRKARGGPTHHPTP